MDDLFKYASLNKLRELYNYLSTDGKSPEDCAKILKRIKEIEEKNCDFEHYSSDRSIAHTREEDSACLEMFQRCSISDVPFIFIAMSSNANSCKCFLPIIEQVDCKNLADLVQFFANSKNIKRYEALYNALNLVKDRFYKVGEAGIFQDYKEKQDICRVHALEIADYFSDIVLSTKLRLSCGDVGMKRYVSRRKLINASQYDFLDSVAFSCDLADLKNGNYEEGKRLIYLPRSVRIDK